MWLQRWRRRLEPVEATGLPVLVFLSEFILVGEAASGPAAACVYGSRWSRRVALLVVSHEEWVLSVRRVPVAGCIRVKVSCSWSKNQACLVKRACNCCVGWALDGA